MSSLLTEVGCVDTDPCHKCSLIISFISETLKDHKMSSASEQVNIHGEAKYMLCQQNITLPLN